VEVSWALACRYAEASPDGTATLVGAGVDSLALPDTPSEVGVLVMLRLAGAAYEFEEAHQLAVKLVDPERDTQEVLSVEVAPMGGPPPLAEPGLDIGLLLRLAIAWTSRALRSVHDRDPRRRDAKEVTSHHRSPYRA
jgi:hypothetical protein